MRALNLVLLLASLVTLAGGYQVTLTPLSTVYLPFDFDRSGNAVYAFDQDIVDRFAFEPRTKFIYALAPGYAVIDVVDATDPTNLRYVDEVSVSHANVRYVEACGDHIYVTYRSMTNSLQGGLKVFQPYDSDLQTMVLVQDIALNVDVEGLAMTHDCNAVIVVEGYVHHFSNGTYYDPPGGVIIVRFPNGPEAAADVTRLDYTKFDLQAEDLVATGVRWLYRGTRFSDNMRGEAVTISPDGKTAYVSLEINNAIGVVDLDHNNITAIRGLGFKQWGELDPSERDGGIHIANWPILGIYNPEQLKAVRWSGEDYVITANRGYIDGTYTGLRGFDENQYGHSFTDIEIDSSVDPALRQGLHDSTTLGNLYFSEIDGFVPGSDKIYNKFYAYGGRSFSVWQASDMQRVYDSGSELEKKTAELRPDLFNSDVVTGRTLAETVDQRSNNMGAEPDAVETAEIGGRLLIFIGTEMPGTLFVYSVEHGRMEPQFETMITGIPGDHLRTWGEMYNARELWGVEIECIRYFGPGFLADYPVLLVAGTESGTITALKVEVRDNGGGIIG